LIGFVAFHLLVFVLLAATAWVAGRLVIREGWAIETALGLTILAHALFALGALGLLNRVSVLLLIAAVHVLGFRVWRDGKWQPGLALALAPAFVLALYPPTAFDETLYHLPYARAFARTGAIPFLPELRYPIFPQLAEMLSTGMLLLAGDVATHLVQLLATLVTAAILISWGGRSGWVAAAIFLGHPIVFHLAGTAYVEPVLTLFATAAVYSLERWRETQDRKWLILLGVFAGSAAAVKYLGLFILAAVLVPLIPRWRGLLLASAAALAVLLPWYGRLVLETGNPLFPFYPEIFGPNPWFPDPAVPGERLAAYLRFPWDVLFNRGAVGNQPPFSPVLLLGLPLLVYGFFRKPQVRTVLGIALAYSLSFLILPPDSRYMTAALPLVSLALAVILSRKEWVLAALLLLPGWAYGVYRIARQGPLPVTAQEREAYLSQKLPVYAALAHLNRRHGEDYTVYGLYAENMVYHAEGTLLGDWNGPARYSQVLPAFHDPEALHRRMRELDADYLLIVRDRGVALPDAPEWRRRFRPFYSDRWTNVYQIP